MTDNRNDTAATRDADVIVVGAGPVGLSLALELGLRGNRVIVLERDASRGPQPRAKTLNMRSLTHMRRWGVAEDIRQASPTPADLPTDIVFQTRLFGHHIATLPNIYFRGNLSAGDERFPEPSEWIPQYVVEGVLKAKLVQLPNVSFKYDCELVGISQDNDSTSAQVQSEAGDSTLLARFVVGADGARSRVREAIGAKLEGRYAFASHFNLVLRIPELDVNPPSPRGIMHWLINADAPSVMAPMGEYWTLGTQLPPEVTDLSHEQINDLVEATTGRSLKVEVVTTDRWYAHELIATHYRDRNVFLAGDACHLHPPFGGYGMNMGIADAVDLGWKLDAVLHGWGGDELLESYEWERKRVHRWTIDESVENYRVLSRDMLHPGLEADDDTGQAVRAAVGEGIVQAKKREFHTIGMVLGGHYCGSPVIAGADTLPPPMAMEHDPRPLPGTLAPHLWLTPGVSIYDRFGSGITLLDTSGEGPSAALLGQAALAMKVPLDHVRLEVPRVLELYGRGYFLIRPDQHVAWAGTVDDLSAAEHVLATITGSPR